MEVERLGAISDAGALAAVLARTPAVKRRFDVVQHDFWAAGETLAGHLRDFDNVAILLLQDVRN